MDFDGTNDYLQAPYDAGQNPVEFSVELWARVEGAGAAGHRAAVSSRDGGAGGSSGYILYAEPGNTWQFWTGNVGGWDVLAGRPSRTTPGRTS